MNRAYVKHNPNKPRYNEPITMGMIFNVKCSKCGEQIDYRASTAKFGFGHVCSDKRKGK